MTQTTGTGRMYPGSTHLRIDMTPLVDLGFLLITFFIFTTTLAESNVLKLVVPTDAIQLTKAPESATVSALLGSNNQVYVYHGKWEDADEGKAVMKSNYNIASGLGAILRAKQEWLASNNKDGKEALVYLIKPAESSSFKNIIDALDEAAINNIQHYIVVPLSKEEESFMKDK